MHQTVGTSATPLLRTGGPSPKAMRLLVQHNIGAVVVVQGATIRGILTERDLLRAGAEDPQRLSQGRVEDLMTREVITARRVCLFRK